jgi:hypothetical protein
LIDPETLRPAEELGALLYGKAERAGQALGFGSPPL